MEAIAEKVEKKVVGARKPTRLKEADHERHVWIVSVPSDVTFEQAQQPDFWAHVGAQLRPCARIEVMPDDMAWFGELIVVSCDRLWAKTAPLRFVRLDEAPAFEVPASLGSGYEVQYKGPTKKHCVIRLSDNQIVREEIQTKAEANAWIAEHVQGLSR